MREGDGERRQGGSAPGETAAVAVSFFGTLPPLKSISVYCWCLCEGLSRRIRLECFSFRRLYPDWLYPGGTKDKTPGWDVRENANLAIRRSLTYYNPLSWLWCALRARGRLIHAQWWSLPVGLVWIVVLGILRLRGRRILMTVHNVEFHEKGLLDRLVRRIVFAMVHSFVVHCEENRQRLAEELKIDPGRIHVMPIPVYDQYCDPGVTQESARERLGIEPGRVAFLLFGNHRDYKGTDVFLRAAGGLGDEQRRRLKILIAGQTWGDLAERYDRLIAEQGLEDQVLKFYDYVPMCDVKYYFEASDVVALPYKHFAAQSGVGSLVLAFGKPLLVTRLGGLPTLVKRPEAIAEPGDVESLRDAIARLMDDPGLREQLAADARALAAERSWDAAADRTLEIYQAVMADAPLGQKGG